MLAVNRDLMAHDTSDHRAGHCVVVGKVARNGAGGRAG